MNKLLIPVLLLMMVFFHVQCRNSTSQSPPVVQQDTTITAQTAITRLVFDSAYVDRFVQEHQFMQDTAQRILNFYISRNFQYAWFNEDGVAEQTRTFWNLRNFYVTSNRTNLLRDTLFEQTMERILNDSTYSILPEEQANIELKLTHHFFAYAQYAYAGTIDPESLQWHIPRKKLDVVALLDSLVTHQGKNLKQWEPVNSVYMNLQSKLKDYAAMDEKGGWDTLPVLKKSFAKGSKDSIIVQVKKRLAWEDPQFVADSLLNFNDSLEVAVNRARSRYGLNENGNVDISLIKELNVPVKKRIEQILINMERGRWLPPTEGNVLIVANIPDYRLRVFEDNRVVLSMNIVVGTVANNSVIFNDELKYIVFAPYWNVPMSIARNEIVPAMRRNKNYLARNNMEITGYNNGVPVVRQKPGKSNSLGLVKFLFPNSYNIYFHDTPSKSLFEREQRAFSHGCIRLQKPVELAKYLLRNQPEWTDEKIQEAMHKNKETWVTLPEAIPVMITYFTAWVDVENSIHFNKDVYGHDKKLAARLFSHAE